MEWTKYVLACTLGVCMLILFGRRDEGRDKWIFGLAVGGSLAAMELTVEYMYGFQCDEESGTVFVDRAGRLWVGMDPQP